MFGEEQPAGDEDVLGAVQRNHLRDSAVAQRERREGQLVEGAADDELVGGSGTPDLLEGVFVLVGPEPVRLAEGIVDADHVLGRRDAVVHGGVVVFHPQVAAVVRVERRRDVSRGEHVGDTGLGELVGENAAVDLQARLESQLHVGDRPSTDEHQVGLDDSAVGVHDSHRSGVLD